jgi:hypothetical protein
MLAPPEDASVFGDDEYINRLCLLLFSHPTTTAFSIHINNLNNKQQTHPTTFNMSDAL